MVIEGIDSRSKINFANLSEIEAMVENETKSKML